MNPIEKLEVGDRLPPVESNPVTLSRLLRYSQVSGDWNPIHTDRAAAEQAGYPNVIAHGVLSMGIAARVISPWLNGRARIEQYHAGFHHPLVEGESLIITGVVTRKSFRSQQELTLTVHIEGHSGENKRILSGEAVLLITNSF